MFTRKKRMLTMPLKDLIPNTAATQLLNEAKRQDLLQKIEEMNFLESPRFDSLCLTLVHNFSDHCQLLPETTNSYFAFPGGFLDHSLNRTEAAVQLFRQFVIHEGDAFSEEQKLWYYALFSASILQGIGKLQLDFRVQIYDVNGQLLKEWNPLLESLTSVGSYYHYELENLQEDILQRRLNVLMARILMPASGFAWIASNPKVLAAWLALLNEDWQSAGTLGAILVRADAIAIQRDINERMLNYTIPRGGRAITTFVDKVPDSTIEKEQQVGAEFIQWLTQSLDSGKIMINKSPLFMVPGGMLMSAEMFQLFVRENPEYKNWQAIQHAFLSLGMHQIGPDGNVLSRFEHSSTNKMHSGIVFADYAVALPNEMKVCDSNTGKETVTSAVDFVNIAHSNKNFIGQQSDVKPVPLSYLTVTGQWQQPEAPATSVRPGNLPSG